MLQGIRDRVHGWITAVLFIVIVLALSLLGVRSWMGMMSGNSNVAEINGTGISRHAAEEAFQRLQRGLEATGQPVPPGGISQLKQAALQSLIDNEVLKQSAITEGYRVSSNQTAQQLIKMPQFQEGGVFSMARFESLAAMAGYTPAAFLDLVGASMVIDQMRTGIFSTQVAYPPEIQSALKLMAQKRSFSWLLLTPQVVADNGMPGTFSADAIKQYYEAHLADFSVPEQISVDYILLSAAHLPTGESLTKIHDRLANMVYETPDSLAPAAKSLGLTVHSTGLFTREKGGSDAVSGTEAVRAAAFSADVLQFGNNSDLIEVGPEAWAVIRLHERVSKKMLPLTTVQDQVLARLKAGETAKNLQKTVQDIRQALTAGRLTREAVASRYHLVWQSAMQVERADSTPGGVLQALAFRLPAPASGQSSWGVTPVDGGAYAIVALDQVKSGEASQNSSEWNKMAEHFTDEMARAEYDSYRTQLVNHAKIKLIEQPAA